MKKLGKLRIERIEDAKKVIGTKTHRKRTKHSDKFNRMFRFYFMLHRSGLVQFCGSDTIVKYDSTGSDAKVSFKEYDNGVYGNEKIPRTRHPNILKSVLIAKKGWGLWCDEWARGIGQGLFTKYEIYEMFREHGLELPESIETEFNNLIWKYRMMYPDGNSYLCDIYVRNNEKFRKGQAVNS
jgi:hypothetical protein